MRRNITILASIILVMVFVSMVAAQNESKKEEGEKTKAKGKWTNTVWKKVNNLAKEKRSFQVEKATTVAGVRGTEAEDRLMKQLYYRGGGKYPSRLELRNAIEILESSVRAAPNDASVPESKYFIGQCHEQLGNTEEAIDTYREIVKYYPDSPYAKDAQQAIEKLRQNQ